MNLSDIKIYIIEDDKDVADNIKKALSNIKDNNGSAFNINNIETEIITDKSATADMIFQKTKEKAKNYDVLFIDLHLGTSIEQGLNLIRQYMHDPIICNIPKYIISSDRYTTTLSNYQDIKHYTTVIIKPQETDIESFIARLSNHKIEIALPLVVEIYRKIKESRTINDIALMVNELEITTSLNHTETMSALDVIYKLLENVDVRVMDLQAKTSFINQATLTILKLLPDAIPQDKASKAKKFIEENMAEWIGDIGDEFFPNNKQSIIKSVIDKFKEVSMDTFKDDWKEIIEEIIKAVAKENNIDIEDSNLTWVTAQLGYKVYASLYAFLAPR